MGTGSSNFDHLLAVIIVVVAAGLTLALSRNENLSTIYDVL